MFAKMDRRKKVGQKTLFQSWNKDPRQETLGSLMNGGKSGALDAARVVEMVTADAFNSSDDDLVEAAEQLESTFDDVPTTSHSNKDDFTTESLPGFDNSLGNIWIYPTNYPVREYQFSIVKNSLMKNTLVSLPTGLGKTFIAAVVMYNFYRWYPQGKIIFMAPTKPLVSQQIEACYKIMGIPLDDQAEITGMTTSVHKREALWSSKRVFFLTPQVINNDLARGVCPAELIKCVVIDEAHKAQGKHAYCQVINQLISHSRNFRVLALSATPGTDVKSVQQVLTNLLISHIEIRSEDSIDIRGFSHQRKVEKVVCKLDETMVSMRDNYVKVIEIFTKSLVSRRALFERETLSYSKYGILMARDQFRKDPPSGLNKYEMGAIEGDFATCISLLHGLELLQQHGMRSFFIFIKAMMEGDKGSMRAKSVLGTNPIFRGMYENLTNMFGASPNPTVLLTQAGRTQQSMQKPSVRSANYVYSHPKIAKLEEVVVQHFESFVQSHEDDATRVMVFCQYRDSVQEITELLQTHRPLVRPMQFVGHSTASGKIAKFTQKDQLQVVSKFRSGGYNTLISTCVGEEGLDIGDVDLIVCFDAHKSPIRLVQRMGRTGRKRKGRIVMLVTEGKEERDYNSSISNKKSIQKAITGNSSRSLKFYEHNPRMIPLGLNPKPLKMHITVIEKEEPVKLANKRKNRKTENSDISAMIKKAEVQQSAYLNPEQVKEWDEKLKLTVKEKEQLKVFPAMGQCVCLQTKKQVPSTSRHELSFSEWTLWQNRLQESKFTGHSSLTKNFVEIMEICDLVKQSDERDFDENLAPFMGGKYDRSQMELGRKRSKLDGYLTSAAKPTKILEKERKPKRASEELIESKESPQKLSLDDDFVSEKLKKVIPERNNFKTKLTHFDTDDENEICESSADYDTLNGIESILDDDLDVAPKSHNKTISEKNFTPTVKKQGAMTEKNDFENPDFDLGDCDMDKLLETKPGGLHGFPKERCVIEGRDKVVEQTSDDVEKTSWIDSSPLVDFIDKLSVIPSETPLDFKNTEQCQRRYSSTLSIPSSLSSISLDFGEQFGSDISDDEERSKKEAFSKSRICFSLGIGEDNDKAGVPAVDMDSSSTRLHVKSAKKLKELNEKSLAEKKSIDPENTCHQVDDFFDMSMHAGDFSKGIVSRLNSETEGDQKKPCVGGETSVAADVSADMFAPQFDIDFDLGVFDDDNGIEQMKMDDCKPASPVLVSKTKQLLSMSSTESNCSIVQDKSKSDSLLGSQTLSQRVENQLFFADRRKLQSGDEVPVAKVKPQVITEDEGAKALFEMNVQNASRVVDDQEKTECLKRERDFESSESIPLKRLKNRADAIFASPVTSANYVLKSPLRNSNFSPYDDSPLLKKKLPIQSKKLLFSPDTTSSSEHSQTSAETRASSKFAHGVMSNVNRSGCSVDSPVTRTKRLSCQERKHSTPKNQAKRKISSDSDDDDDFEVNVKPRISIQKNVSSVPTAKKPVSRGRMKDFIDEEAEVSHDGFKVSSDEDDEIDPRDLEEMKSFVNDATILTQHVNDGSTVDEEAMYLQRKPDFFEEEGRFQGHNGKFKLRYDVENHVDVFSQEVPTDVSGYEEDSFVCDDEVDIEIDDITALGEVTVLKDTPTIAGRRQRMTRRRAELNRLQKMDYSTSASSSAVDKLEKETIKKDKQGRRRIVCFDDSTDSVEIDHSLKSPRTETTLLKSSPPEQWSCPACTLINKGSTQICELCDSERPNSVSGNMEGTAFTWTCTLCTYVNRTKSDVCRMCGEPPKSAVTKPKKTCPISSISNQHTKEKNKNFSFANSDIIPPTPAPLDCNIKKQSVTESPCGSASTNLGLASHASPNSPHSVGSSFSTASNEEREARLKRCKQKQMEFRARMQKRRSGQLDKTVTISTPAKSSDALTSTKRSLNMNTPRNSYDLINSSIITPTAKESKESSDKNVVLVDSKELSSSQDILTSLRSKHNAHVTVVSLTHCDYVVGRGTAVERRTVSDLSQASTRQKMASRFQHLHFIYDRIYLIIEQDRIKKKGFGQSEGRASHNGHYISTMCSLALTNIRILYSSNQEETANILVMLASREKSLKRDIDLEAAVKASNAKDRSLIQFYSSIPKVSLVSALYMCLNFKNLKETASSSVEKLIQKAHLPTSSAAEVYTFFRREFDLQMTPSR